MKFRTTRLVALVGFGLFGVFLMGSSITGQAIADCPACDTSPFQHVGMLLLLIVAVLGTLEFHGTRRQTGETDQEKVRLL
jgi:hypothetical protein